MMSSSVDPETGWMIRLQKGDQSGFTEILKRYEKPVLNFSYKYLFDVQLAEDVTQDVFIEIYKRAKSYKPVGKLSTWIFTIAAHRCLNLKRKKQPEPIDLQSEQSFINQKDPNPAQIVENQEVQHLIRTALFRLPENQRVAVLLAKYENIPLENIADLLNISVGAVKQLLHRAKQSLRDQLTPSPTSHP